MSRIICQEQKAFVSNFWLNCLSDPVYMSDHDKRFVFILARLCGIWHKVPTSIYIDRTSYRNYICSGIARSAIGAT